MRGLRSPNIAHHNHSALQLAADASVERNPFPTGDARTSTFWPVHRHEPLPAAHPYPPDCRASVSPVFSIDGAPATLFASQSSPHCLNRRPPEQRGGRRRGKRLSSNRKCVSSLISRQRGSPQSSAFIGVHRRPSVFLRGLRGRIELEAPLFPKARRATHPGASQRT